MKHIILKACKDRKIKVAIAPNIWITITRKQLTLALNKIIVRNERSNQQIVVTYDISDSLIYINIKTI